MESPQTTMQRRLESCGLPYHHINVYGRQIVVTCLSNKARRKWTSLLENFARVRGCTDGYDLAKTNRNTVLKPSRVRVYRVFAAV